MVRVKFWRLRHRQLIIRITEAGNYMKSIIFALCLFSTQLLAQLEQFHAGKIITNYGKVAEIEGMEPIPQNTKFKVSFDVAKPAEVGGINRSLDSVARFINMHVAAGVAIENIDLAVVIHGGSVTEMTGNDFYQKEQEKDLVNANIPLIKALQSKGVVFYVCGQSAAYYGVKTSDLLPNVKMALSAMTAHALLQQQGYTLNPF